ncbi:MAG: hypothetical protein COX17_10935 [Deltaproteobacteria bacterium CG23_combo_of_CG06-09_8_20_14_all_60_8]|nr:MAG: hypothetical protein AUK28_01330 [Desulfobacterales bacterium CG2_30_60_27]PIP42740.1 MAG: hypothetical protein COX17_10935 [Deltaproteobacteria bacterium CG23_combo_of_CG06-09_8_20_14_all_60_8]
MRVKIATGMALLLLVVIFTLQNTELIVIQFLFWHFSLSRALMLFLVLAVGILIGFMAGRSRLDNAKDVRNQSGGCEKNGDG